MFCIASPLSADLPGDFESRSDLSGVTRLFPFSSRLNVDPDTPRFTASSRPLMPFGSRQTEVMNSPG